MSSLPRRYFLLLWAAATVATLAIVVVLASVPRAAGAASLGELQSELAAQQARQQGLRQSIGGLSASASALEGQISLVQSREAAMRAELAHDEASLAATRAALGRERRRLKALQAALAWARALLARQLVSGYEGGSPDLMSVVLEAHGFADLLDRITFLRDAEGQQQRMIALTRAAKAAAEREARKLATLEATDRQLASGAALRVRALAGMDSLLGAKQSALARALLAQQSALSASRAAGGALEGEIAHVRAEQAAAAAAAQAEAARAASAAPSGGSGEAGGGAPSVSLGPALGAGGSWAIPSSVVLCESGGQDLPPNGAGASGYYQIVPGTWQMYGGTGSAAYLAPKSEQDAVARRIWAGAGASSWVCAGMVGVH